MFPILRRLCPVWRLFCEFENEDDDEDGKTADQRLVEARAAVAAVNQQLLELQSKGPEIDELSLKLKLQRVRNHFTQRIIAAQSRTE